METLPTMWEKSKLLVKGFLILGLVLVLLIPTFFVRELILEREDRQKEAVNEVSSKWASRQKITGPVLVLPYAESSGDRKLAYVLPDTLTMIADVNPEKRHRGIYQVMLYSSAIKMSGTFNKIPLQQLGLDSMHVLWNEAYICLGFADQRGLREDIKFNLNGADLNFNPMPDSNGVMANGFSAPVNIPFDKPFDFSASISLNGSEQLLFVPIAKKTIVRLSSSWPDPSFTGDALPDYKITQKGFTATWESLAHNRSFPQAWKETRYQLGNSSFGADLFIPVNGYQKTMRSVKYAVLCILLTFAAFFIIETINKKSVHPFQYGLIGIALVLFYTLLLSFSEYTGFNVAYVIASVATIGLIAWFVKDLLQSGKLTTVLSVILVLMYSYLFTILQIQDYSLLLGSVGLFLTLAVIMHFSKRIKW